MMDLEQFKVSPRSKVRLADFDPGDTAGIDRKSDGIALLASNVERLEELQERLHAEDRRSLLVVLQGLDTSGKDGTTRAVFTGVNPNGVDVHSFGRPGPEDLDHDYLWRVHRRTPGRGDIGVFNRSQYEDVLIARVEKLVPKATWSRRYRHINEFERMLVDEGTTIIKCFLHISSDEQMERLESRIETPRKNWKIEPADFEARARWRDYIQAYEDVMEKCSTRSAPWWIVPANRKWVRNAVVSEIVRQTLEKMDPKYPRVEHDLDEIRRLAAETRRID